MNSRDSTPHNIVHGSQQDLYEHNEQVNSSSSGQRTAHQSSSQSDQQDNVRQQNLLLTEEVDIGTCCVGVCTCTRCVVDICFDSNENVSDDHHDENLRMPLEVPKPDRYNWEDPLLPDVKTTKFEAFMMVLHMAMRHGMSGPFIEDMLRFVNSLFEETVIRTSKYIFQKLFSPKSALKYRFFCLKCEFYLGEHTRDNQSTKCLNCGEECNTKDLNGGNFFITLSLRTQLEDLLRRSDVRILPHLRKSPDIISDIMDGYLYKKLCEPGNPLADPNSISVTFNTDGAPVFNSGNNSIWPVQFFVNELAPEHRFRAENMLLHGLWFGSKSPNMSFFLNRFMTEMEDLGSNGIRQSTPNGFRMCRVFAITCSVDSVAKPKLQKIIQFNGRYGCGYCLHPNDPINTDGDNDNTSSDDDINDPTDIQRKGPRRYVSGVDYSYRTHGSMTRDMVEADRLDALGLLKRSRTTDDHINGLKGLSPLLGLSHFDVVNGFTIDYMHAILAGVSQRLTDLWFDSSNHVHDYYIGNKRDIVDARVMALTPPQNILRRPRPISMKGDYKAKEWRAFLLFYSIPCLNDILPPECFDNLTCLVSAIFILLKSSISREELTEADYLLPSFVKNYNRIYGDINMVYNIHLCTHLARMVYMWGPLWAYSAFSFESGNGHLLKLLKRTTGVASQICQKYVTIKSVVCSLEEHPVSSSVLDFCSKIIDYKYDVKQSSEFPNCGRALGNENVAKVNDAEITALLNAGFNVTENQELIYFNRVVKDGVLYYSKAYKKPKIFDDTCVRLCDQSYAVIEKIVRILETDSLWALIRPVRISAGAHFTQHIHTCAFDTFGPLKAVCFTSISCKSILLTVEGQQACYVCDFPNFYEKD